MIGGARVAVGGVLLLMYDVRRRYHGGRGPCQCRAVPWTYASLPPASRPDDACFLDQVNDRIRRLTDEPAGDERSASYAQLLVEWAEVSRDDVEQAA